MSKAYKTEIKSEYRESIDFISKIENTNQHEHRLKDSDFDAMEMRVLAYTRYLCSYVFEYKSKLLTQRKLKIIFFVIINLLLIAMIAFCFIIINKVLSGNFVSTVGITAIISTTVGLITSFFILPKIIAENLFPAKDEDISEKVFGDMFKYDIELRNMYHVPEKNQSDDVIFAVERDGE